ncbi:MAG TPA: TRAP transporter substrate-binding protein [Jiangellaceae bacterium]|nr:TRAP transporter substrate-binding protein [Jiangellaceae bacterium]
MPLTRRDRVSLALTTSVALLTLAACGDGAPRQSESSGTTLRLALNQTEEHPSFVALDNFGQRLSESTDGRWNIDVYPNATLGAQQEVLQLVGDGVVEMAIVSGTQLENVEEDFRVFNMPQVFDSVEHQMDVIHDPAIVGELYSSLEDQNVTVLGGFTQGTRSIYTSDGPVRTPEDLDGQKIRVQESELHISMMERMGGAATPMAYGEVYTALQSGVLDGAENNEVSYVSAQHFEVAPYFSNTNHLVGVDYLVISTDRLDAMSEQDRAAFEQEWTAAHEEHTELWAEATEQAIADAKAGGAQFNDVDTEAFRSALEPMADEALTTDTQRELYEATRAGAD